MKSACFYWKTAPTHSFCSKYFLNRPQLGPIWLPRKLSGTSLNASYAVSSLLGTTSSKYLSFISSCMWERTKILLLQVTGDTLRLLLQIPFRFKSFAEFFISSSPNSWSGSRTIWQLRNVPGIILFV